MADVYLDWAATTPLHPEAADTQRFIGEKLFGNPSSIHKWGMEARELLESCRERCGRLLGAEDKQVIFTSGGSESNNIVFTSFLHKNSPGHAIVPLFEHASVYEPSRMLERFGWEITRIQSGADARIDPERILSAIQKKTSLIALMVVNNETGAIQPVGELVKEIRSRETEGRPIHIHADGVQAVGKIPVNFQDLGVDSLSVSSHKFRGPRGAGMLLVRKVLQPLQTGGGQENGMRPGTENLPGIAGMTHALELSLQDLKQNYSHAETLMNALLQAVTGCRQCRILPEERMHNPQGYSPYIATISFPPIPGEVLVRVLSEKGYGVSTGSACSSRKKRDTRVLEASGISSSLSFSSIRVSIGSLTTEEEIEDFSSSLLQETGILFQVAK
ncbi:MAG: cysteine desulfurase [Spirochaetales bacterium]|nr:cysteine desulfurase [Spirochaetales bacterium]